jgi:polyisoprenyl-phosphate glycosyltransferase
MNTTEEPVLRRDRDPRLVSVVVPAYNEEGNVDLLIDRVSAALEGLTWELVIVDDGSADHTFRRVLARAAEDPRIRGLSFSRNFGHQYALLAGLKAAGGEVVISMDADLQHPPELLPTMVERWRAGFNIVHTKRHAGQTLSVFKRVTSDLYYKVFSALSDLPLEEGQSDFRLLDRRVVDVLVQLDQAELFFRGLVHWVGYTHTTLAYQVGERHWGESKYSFRKMLRFAVQGLTAFSTVPLRIGVTLGFLTSVLAFAEFAYVVGVWAFGEPVPGWASLAAITSLLFAVAFALIGFIGIYLGHVFQRVQRTPQFLVETTTEEALAERGGEPEPAGRLRELR